MNQFQAGFQGLRFRRFLALTTTCRARTPTPSILPLAFEIPLGHRRSTNTRKPSVDLVGSWIRLTQIIFVGLALHRLLVAPELFCTYVIHTDAQGL